MTRERPEILVVEPDREASHALAAILRREGFEVIEVHDGEKALNVLATRRPACIVSVLEARRVDGLELQRQALARNADVCVVFATAEAPVARVVEAMRAGAYDVQQTPVHPERLLAVLRRGIAHQALAERVTEMESQLDEHLGLEGFAGASRTIHRVLEQVRSVSPSQAPIVIEGEHGTGRHRLAQMIHRHSPRRDGRFVWASLSAPGEGVVEADLFGVAGDLGPPRPGRFELADRGTLYLDEIGEASPGVQVRLLRAVQERAFERVGGTESRRSDVRIIASTSRDLAADVRAGRFRDDLLQRLAVVRIAMPPLRERREDIPVLVQQLIEAFNRQHGRKVVGATPGALDRLSRHDWPGNVRELRNVVEGMVVATHGRRALDVSDLPSSLVPETAAEERLDVRVGMTVEDTERRLIAATLRHTGGDKRRAASLLGIGLRTLYRKIEEYRLG
jgi:DNA-binding NtrC family response regulator